MNINTDCYKTFVKWPITAAQSSEIINYLVYLPQTNQKPEKNVIKGFRFRIRKSRNYFV